MKKLFLPMALLLAISSCSIKKNVLVTEIRHNELITSNSDTIKARERLTRVMEPNFKYNLKILNGRCVDARILRNQNKTK